MITKSGIGLLVAGLWSSAALATNVFVVMPGTLVAQYPYTNWGMAATNIQDAIDAIVTNDGNYVFVSNGTYYLTNQVVITNGITLQSWNQGVLDQTNTVIHGNNYPDKPVTNRCVYMNHPLARLVGFTITKGWATNDDTLGGGIYVANNGFYVADCIITGNMADNTAGGIYAAYSTGIIERCIISRNYCANQAGGMIISSGSITMRQCVVSFNTSQKLGGGAYLSGAGIEARECNIISNQTSAASAGNGGGLLLRTGATARNCLIVGNTSKGTSGGGGVSFWSGNSKVINCTITGNSAGSYNKGGGLAPQDGNMVYYIENSIVYGNSSGAPGTYSNYFDTNNPPFGEIRWTNNCSAPSLNDLSPGTNVNNIAADPQFAGVSTGNYRLARSSPCVNTGVNRDWMTPQAGGLDLDGNHRIMMGVVDMGAYELLPPVGTIFEFY